MPPKSAGGRNERESLWSVSAKRLPYYLISFAAVMAVTLLTSSGTAISGGAKFWASVVSVAEDIAAVGAATGGVLIAIEGTIMGVTKLIIEKTKERAHAQGVKQGRQQTVQYYNRALKEKGVDIKPPPEEEPEDTRNP